MQRGAGIWDFGKKWPFLNLKPPQKPFPNSQNKRRLNLAILGKNHQFPGIMHLLEFTIRPVRPDDSPAMCELIKPIYEEYGFPWDPDDFDADLCNVKTHYIDPGTPFFVAETETGLLGYCGISFHPKRPGNVGEKVFEDGLERLSGSDCEIHRLYIRTDLRGAGVGKELFEKCLEEAKSRSCSLLEIWSDQKLERAHAFYEKYGAKRIANRICNDALNSPEWGFLLALDR